MVGKNIVAMFGGKKYCCNILVGKNTVAMKKYCYKSTTTTWKKRSNYN